MLKKDKLYFCHFQSQKNLYSWLSIYFTESKRHEKENRILLTYISDSLFFGQHIINMIYHLSLGLSNVHFFPYYGACHFSKRKKVMRNQCKVLSHPPLCSGAGGVSTRCPLPRAVCPSAVRGPCGSLSAPFSLLSLSLPLPPPDP